MTVSRTRSRCLNRSRMAQHTEWRMLRGQGGLQLCMPAIAGVRQAPSTRACMCGTMTGCLRHASGTWGMTSPRSRISPGDTLHSKYIVRAQRVYISHIAAQLSHARRSISYFCP